MDRRRLTLLTLVGALCGKIQTWDQPEFCHGQPCPEYTVTETNADFEERRYKETQWLTIRVPGDSSTDFLTALSVLKAYSEGQEVSSDSWPLLTYMEKTADGEQYFMSRFVAPGTQFHSADNRVQIRGFSGTTVFVRSFSGPPTAESAKGNAQRLMDDLGKAGKHFEQNYFVAFYDSFFSLTHYSEVWVRSL